MGPAYQTPFAALIRREVPELAVMTVGMIDTPERAEGLLLNGDADLIALGRPLLGDPHWMWKAAVAMGVKPQSCLLMNAAPVPRRKVQKLRRP
ncbi:hypothetical protein ACFSC4_02785 [Deinococcus malanensis]|uniref:oxidoreductase n=1 Tax=Deinococcus malanensis TaxID=1706855 RepID=UPI003634CF59